MGTSIPNVESEVGSPKLSSTWTISRVSVALWTSLDLPNFAVQNQVRALEITREQMSTKMRVYVRAGRLPGARRNRGIGSSESSERSFGTCPYLIFGYISPCRYPDASLGIDDCGWVFVLVGCERKKRVLLVRRGFDMGSRERGCRSRRETETTP